MTEVIERPKVIPLSVIPAGHWRCVYRLLHRKHWTGQTGDCGCIWGTDGIAIECIRHVSREIADEWGAKEQHVFPGFCEYVEAQFFPGEPA